MPIRVVEGDAPHCQNKETYAHKMHVPGKSHLPAFPPRGYDEFLKGRYCCREELGAARFSRRLTHVKSLGRSNDISQGIPLP